MFRLTLFSFLGFTFAAFGQPKAVSPHLAAAPVPSTTPASTGISSPINDVPMKMADEFFASLEKEQIDEAYANLTKGSKIFDKPGDLDVLKTKTKEAVRVFGAIQGYELIETKPVGAKLMRRTYLSLGAEYPLRWRFYFYLANNRWRLIDLRVDDRLAGMFDEPKEAPAEENKSGQP
jgi:hypothetical protein